MQLDPHFSPAIVNLADLFRASGDEESVGELLHAALEGDLATDAALQHSYGLHWVRQQQLAKAMAHLKSAAELAPENARYAYVYALAAQSAGDLSTAIAVLETAVRNHPFDRDSLMALGNFYLQAGDNEKAAPIMARLRELSAE